MPRSRELFTPEMYEQNLAAIAAISKLNAFTDTDYAELATLDDEFWRIQNISDYDYTQSTYEVFYEKIFQRQITYGKALQRAEEQINKFGNLKYYKWFRFNHKYPRFSDTHTEPDERNTTKYTCCVCNHSTYGPADGFDVYHFAAHFHNRSKDVVSDHCSFENCKRWVKFFEPRPMSYADAVKFKPIPKEEQEPELVCEKFDDCCYRSHDETGYVIHHCKNQEHCKCFTIQSRDNMKMLSGGYGSCRADNQDYVYCGPEEKFQDDGRVCDWCINDMVLSGEMYHFSGS